VQNITQFFLNPILPIAFMSDPNLTLFDIGGLASRLEKALAEPEDTIRATNFVEKTPKKSPFLHRTDEWEAYHTTKCKLVLTTRSRGLGFLLGIGEDEQNLDLGYIFLEEGYIDAGTDYNGYYEAIKMRLKHPLKLEGGLVIPPCSIKISHEAHPTEASKPLRKDHVRKFGLYWQHTDLSRVLPTDWFFPKPKYAKRPAQNYRSANSAVSA
jgi:hypothetical protein